MNDDSQYLEELEEKRFRVLLSIYRATKADTDKEISLGDIANYIDLSENEIFSISKHLIGKGFLVHDPFSGMVLERDNINLLPIGITQKGITEVESKLRESNDVSNKTPQILTAPHHFIDENRLKEIKNFLSKSKFDLSKLIRLCEELNSSYLNGNYYATAMLTRSILDHVPPIFKAKNFNEVASNYAGSKSFKKVMTHLNNFQKNIAHGFLHEQIRDSESLPNATQVNCSQALDTLLAEIIRILKKSEN